MTPKKYILVVQGEDGLMRKKNIVILLAIMVFFATLTISKNQAVASGSIPAVNYISTYNNDVISKDIPETYMKCYPMNIYYSTGKAN